MEEEVKNSPKRWQANYAFLVARFNAQLAYLEEYAGLIGSARKGLPEPFDPKIHGGWKLAAKERVSDRDAKKRQKDAAKAFPSIAKKYQGTPWEVLSKRENLTSLGLEFQPY